MNKKTFPKRVKLITDGGFSMMINIKEFTPVIHYPIMKRITLSTPETGALDMTANFNIEFMFEKAYKNYAIYKQYNVCSIVK